MKKVISMVLMGGILSFLSAEPNFSVADRILLDAKNKKEEKKADIVIDKKISIPTIPLVFPASSSQTQQSNNVVVIDNNKKEYQVNLNVLGTFSINGKQKVLILFQNNKINYFETNTTLENCFIKSISNSGIICKSPDEKELFLPIQKNLNENNEEQNLIKKGGR